ncbi:MAG TPA: beta-ketoacyl-[acyl-carrier-protein] synthase family protein [Candidatus Acidoferrales bacterium]|nr:beta-ketoacyl-[acyl-carrier-protein] synthase family protein [Candidatus Acidoferrales bacterium]
MRRVVITGAGSVNALGVGVEAFANGLREARCAIETLSLFEAEGYRSICAAQVADLSAPAWLPHRIAARASRSDLLATIAAREAFDQAGWTPPPVSLGIVLGATTGGMFGGEAYARRWLAGNPLGPVTMLLETPANFSMILLGQVFRCEGPRLTVSTACSSGANAIGIAADWIRRGRADAVLCGGVDSLCRMTFSGFNALQAMDTVPCRPFDRRRAGLSLGEGAAMFILEAEDSARARGAAVLAEVCGYGVSADAHHITQPRQDGAGALLAMQKSLADADIAADEIDYINAHGTGTPLNDVIETVAIKSLLGRRAYEIPVSSTKSMIGHCLAAGGAVEALACLIALRDGFVPATANLEVPDPECDLDYVPKVSRSRRLRTVLTSSYGFGGNNSSLVLRRVDG